MSLLRVPLIEPYAMPGLREFESGAASWSVDPSRAALLLHDMQEFFLRGFPDTPSPRGALVSNCARLRSACLAAGAVTGYTLQPGSMTPEQRGLLNTFWGPGMSADDADRGVPPELALTSEDKLITKWRYSAFHGTDLAEWLARTGRDQLVVCGVYAHIGVLTTAIDSFSRDIETFVVGDAVADFSVEDHTRALRHASRTCASVVSTDEVVQALTAPVEMADA